MDPNECLDRINKLIGELMNGPEPSNDTFELIDLFSSLDGWLRKGGFLPTAWNLKTNRLETAIARAHLSITNASLLLEEVMGKQEKSDDP